MQFEAIERRRVALLFRRIETMIGAVRPSNSWMSDVAVALVRTVVGLDSSRQSSRTTEVAAISRAAAQYLLIFSEFQLMNWGEHIAYYPAGTSTRIASLIIESKLVTGVNPGELYSLAELIDFIKYELAPVSDFERNLVGRYQYLTLEAIWRDAVTPELARCVELVLFANEQRWNQKISELDHLTRRLEQNPALIPSSDEVDRVAWALTGAEDLYEDDSITWTAAWRAFRSETDTGRVEELTAVRARIINLRDVLTSDGSMAAAQWFSRQPNPQTRSIGSPEFGVGF